MKIDIINACSDLGVTVNGTENGPLQLLGYFNSDQRIDRVYTVVKPECNKSIDKDDKKKNITYINDFNQSLYNKVLEIKNCNIFPIIIGGDHSISIASSLASIKKEESLGLIWIDAHGDFNTFETTTSGNIHGMPFATITKQNDAELTPFFDGNFYDPKKCVLVGARSIDLLEYKNLKKAGITIFTTEDIINFGVPSIMDKAFKIATNNTNGVHISFDLDIIDPLIAPGVSTPVQDGVDLKDTFLLLDEALQNIDKIKSFDIVEYNPSRDIDYKTYKIVISLLEKIIAKLNEKTPVSI